MNPLWPSGHEAKYNHWPKTSSCGCSQYLQAWPSLHLLQIIQTPLKHLFSSIPWALNAPSTMPHRTGRMQFLQCLLNQVKWSWHRCRLLCDSQPYNLTESAECPWTWKQGEVVRASLPPGFTFWLWSWSTLCTWAHLITSWGFSFLTCQVEVIIPTSQDLRWCHCDPTSSFHQHLSNSLVYSEDSFLPTAVSHHQKANVLFHSISCFFVFRLMISTRKVFCLSPKWVYPSPTSFKTFGREDHISKCWQGREGREGQYTPYT